MLIRKYSCYIFILILQFVSFSCTHALTDEEKIRIFYKNDWMFFYGEKQNVKPELLAEESKIDELFSIDKISEGYRNVVKEYLATFQDFVNMNLKKIQDYHDYITKKSSTKDYFLKLDKKLTDSMQNDLLPKLKNGIRCMLAVNDIQYIEVAKKIDQDKYAVTLTLNTIDNVFWTRLLYYNQNGETPNILDSQGAIKYPEWFYESNYEDSCREADT